MRKLLISLAIAGLAAGSVAVPVSAAGSTRMVDNDGKASIGDCAGTGSAFKKIQPAVAASGKNDTVLVCPGTYRGQVIIPASKDGLTLRSVTHWGATIESPVVADDDEAIVSIAPGADGVTVAHFRVLHRAQLVPTAGGDACGWGMGILVEGRDALIASNKVFATGNGTLSECGLWSGIFVGPKDAGEDRTADAVVRYNIVKDVIGEGIRVSGAGSSMTAFRNIVRYHHLGVAIPSTAAARGTIAGLTDGAIGIGTLGGSSGSIRENTVSSHPSHGPWSDVIGNWYIDAGILVEPTFGDVTVKGNRVYRTDTGIRVLGTQIAADPGTVTVTGNLVLANDVGIRIYTSGARISDNRAFGNSVGLRAKESSFANTFEDNEADGNEWLDCLDESSGQGTANTANTWTGNIGNPADPDGICDSNNIR